MKPAIIYTSIDDINGKISTQVTYTPSFGFNGVDECIYKACVIIRDQTSGEILIDAQKCYVATVTIIVNECEPLNTPEVSNSDNCMIVNMFWFHVGCQLNSIVKTSQTIYPYISAHLNNILYWTHLFPASRW